MTLDLRLAGRRRARQTIRFTQGGSRVVRLRLDRRARRILRRAPRARLRLVGVVHDADTGQLLHRLSTRPTRLRR
jgi:hypothetical protein